MSALSELHNDWLGGARLSGVLFLMNDYVEVISGKHVGELGSVVSISQFDPIPCYVVETDTGKNIVVTESEIQIANS
jgi:ribosomal protein L24